MERIVFVTECSNKFIPRQAVYIATLMVAFYINYAFLGDGLVLQILLCVLLLVSISAPLSGRVKRMTPREAYEYLTEKYKDGSAK